MKELGFTDKSSEPANYKLPENVMKMRKTRKLNCLHEISAKVVDEFVFNSGPEVNGLIDRVLTEQEKDVLQQQELTPDGRFHADLSTMEKLKGVINFLMTHLLRLTVTSLSRV